MDDDSLAELAQHIDQGKDIPREIAGYEILGEIGRGGMGVVYRARQTTLNRIVALKLIISGAAAQEQEILRFAEEARAVANIHHPNIVIVHDAGKTEEGKYYFSMEYVPGKVLSEAICDKEITPKRALEITGSVASALACAHDKGIIHRDIKPSNILLDVSGNPKVMDFGLAKKLSGERLTLSGTVLGTPQYMPPEQAEGKTDETDKRSDIYSLGAVLYEMLTGRPPFQGNSIPQILYQVVHETTIPPSTFEPSLNAKLDDICLKALEKKPSKRYQNASDFKEAIDRYLESPQKTEPDEDTENREVLSRLSCVSQPDPPFKIKVWTKEGPAQKTRNIAIVPKVQKASYSIGDNITVYFSADRDCHLYLLNIGPTGDITVLFPNQFAQDNEIKAGEVYTFPREDDGFDFALQAPSGKEVIKAIATLAPLNLLEMDPAKMEEAFYSVPKKQRMRNIAIVAKKVTVAGNLSWSEARCEFEKKT